MSFESPQPQPAKEERMKLPRIEVQPDVVNDLVRKTQAYRELYPVWTAEVAAGAALADHYGNEPETTGLVREKRALLAAILKEMGVERVQRDRRSRRPTRAPVRRSYQGSTGPDHALPRGDRDE